MKIAGYVIVFGLIATIFVATACAFGPLKAVGIWLVSCAGTALFVLGLHWIEEGKS